MIDVDDISRIVSRCEADLCAAHVLEGTGAPITLRRARVVESLARGGSAADVAAEFGVPAERVAAITCNVSEHGRAALYPSFRERVPRELTDDQRSQIRDLSGCGSTATTSVTMEVLRDRAVRAGVVVDLSDLTLERAFRRRRPWARSTPVMRSQSPRRELVSGAAMLLIGSVGLAALVGAAWNNAGVWLIVAFWAVLPPAGLALIWSGVHGVRANRGIAELNEAGSWPPPVVRPGGRAASPRTDQRIEIRNGLDLPDPGPAVGDPAPEILYLWVFADTHGQRVVFSHGWAAVGPVRLLVHTTSVASRRRRRVARELRESVVHDARSLARHLDLMSSDHGRHSIPDVTFGTGGQATYTGFPMTALVCTDGWWTAAFDALFERADLVVVNLSGFSLEHPGLEHELATVLRPPSLAPEVFLIDDTTDADAAIRFVSEVYEQVGGRDPLVFVRHRRTLLDPTLSSRWLAAVALGGTSAGRTVLDDDIATTDGVARRIWAHMSA